MSEYYYVGVEQEDTKHASGVFMRLGHYINNVGEYGYMPAPYRNEHQNEFRSEGIFLSSSGNFVINAQGEGHIQHRGKILSEIDGGINDTNKNGDISVYLDGGNITIHSDKKVTVESETGDMVFDAENAKASSTARHINKYTFGKYRKKLRGTLTKIARGGHAVSTNVSLSLILTYYKSPTTSLKAGLTISSCPYSLSFTTLKISAVAAIKLSIMGAKSMKYTMDDVAFCFCYSKIRGYQLETGFVASEAGLGKTVAGTVMLHQAAAYLSTDAFKFSAGITSDLPG